MSTSQDGPAVIQYAWPPPPPPVAVPAINCSPSGGSAPLDITCNWTNYWVGVVDSAASFVSVPSGALVLTTNSGTLSTTLGSTDTYSIELKAVRSSQSQTGNTTVTVNP